MDKDKRKKIKKVKKRAVSNLLIATLLLGMGNTTEINTMAAEAEQDYIIVFNDMKKSKELTDEIQTTKMNQEGKELLQDAKMMVAQITHTEAEKLEQDKDIVSVEKDFLVSANANEKEEVKAIQKIAREQWNKKAVHVNKKKGKTMKKNKKR